MEKEISPAKLRQALKQTPGEVFLIDLMTKEEFAESHVPGAVNIPVAELEDHLSQIPKDKQVVVVCRKGLTKSDMALEKLNNSGFSNTKKLEGGTLGWFENSNQ